jgi:hypothetical protein
MCSVYLNGLLDVKLAGLSRRRPAWHDDVAAVEVAVGPDSYHARVYDSFQQHCRYGYQGRLETFDCSKRYRHALHHVDGKSCFLALSAFCHKMLQCNRRYPSF